MSVAEAMLAGCVPVLTRAGALPEVAGDCGVFVDEARPELLAPAIEKALLSSNEERARIRQRILSKFPMERRTRLLKSLIDSLLLSSSPSWQVTPRFEQD